MEKNSKKIFNCENCEKGFSSNEYKKKHISIVHGEGKTIVCNVCSSSFGFKKELKNHMKSLHDGQKNSNVIHVENLSLHQEV